MSIGKLLVVFSELHMKVFERETAGYSDEFIESFFRRSLFSSSFFDQPSPVRGVCFAAGPDSGKLAQEFAQERLSLGTITLRLEKMTPRDWQDLMRFLTKPNADLVKVGILLPNLHLASDSLQGRIAETIQATDNLLWFSSSSDLRKIKPELKRALVVFLGLSPKNRMRFLLQDGQQLLIDQGSLQRMANN